MSEEIVQVSKPTKIDNFDLETLCKLLSSGHTVNSACIKVGISVRTFNRWRLLGQDPEEEEVFQEFYFQTESARMKAVNHLVDELYNQAQYDPRVAMWLAERLYPEQFSLKPEFRKTKDDIKAEEFQDTPQVIEISFGDDPQERKIKRAVKRQELETFLDNSNLELGTERSEFVKQYEKYLEENDND